MVLKTKTKTKTKTKNKIKTKNKKLYLFGFILLFVAFVVLIGSVDAATYVSTNGTGSGSEEDPANVQNAIKSTDNEIILSEGVYKDKNIFINKDVTIRSKNAKSKAIFDGDKLGSVFIINGSYDVTFINIIFKNLATSSNSPVIYGKNCSNLDIVGCEFRNCNVDGNLVSIYNTNVYNSNLILKDSVFTDNACGSVSLIVDGGLNSVKNKFTVINSTFIGNNHVGNTGIANSAHSNNTANVETIIINSYFERNIGSSGRGGAVFSSAVGHKSANMFYELLILLL